MATNAKLNLGARVMVRNQSREIDKEHAGCMLTVSIWLHPRALEESYG